jgi:hypothetical protein
MRHALTVVLVAFDVMFLVSLGAPLLCVFTFRIAQVHDAGRNRFPARLF